MEFAPGTMQKLAELLRPPEPEILQGEDIISAGVEITSNRGKSDAKENIHTSPKTIEEFEAQEAREAEALAHIGGGLGDRRTPEYTMNYQQAVGAEDVFLQMGPKTTASASCEHLKVRVKMPGDKMENIDLSVDKSTVIINSSQYHLCLPLPHGIDPDASRANWDSSEQTLILTLKLDREFDFVNF